MKSAYSSLMQSRFFNPAFNSAIFDGPVRIYFAQFHESLALKLYFGLQQKYSNEIARAKELSRQLGQNVLVMIYPTKDAFKLSFDSDLHHLNMAIDDLSGDTIIGLNGPIEDNEIDNVLQAIVCSMREWKELAYTHERPFEAQP